MVKHVIIWTLKTEYSDSEKRAAAEKIKRQDPRNDKRKGQYRPAALFHRRRYA